MQSSRVVFRVGVSNTSVDMKDHTIISIANVFFPGKPSTMLPNLSDEHLAGLLEHEDLSKLVFVGASTTKTFGDYTPEKFVERVNSIFPRPRRLPKKSAPDYQEISEANHTIEQRKLLVTDVYILNSFVGVVDNTHTSLAQEIADQLYKKGFTNVKVHNLAFPEHAKGYRVTLGITDSAALVAQIEHPSAFHDVFRFVAEADLEKELDKPQHIFLPNQKRVVSDIDNHRRYILNALEDERKLLAKKWWSEEHKLIANHLQIIISQITAASHEDWFTIFKQARGLFDSYVAFGRESPKPGNRVKLLLKELYEHEITRQALDKQQHRVERLAVLGHSSDKGKDEELTAAKAEELSEPQNEDQRGQLISSQPVGLDAEAFQRYISGAPDRESVTDHHVHENILKIIRAQVKSLEEANHRLKVSCFASFFTNKIAVKTEKIKALQTLVTTTTYADMKKNAEAAKNNQSVMAGFFSRKTRHILELIAPPATTVSKVKK